MFTGLSLPSTHSLSHSHTHTSKHTHTQKTRTCRSWNAFALRNTVQMHVCMLKHMQHAQPHMDAKHIHTDTHRIFLNSLTTNPKTTSSAAASLVTLSIVFKQNRSVMEHWSCLLCQRQYYNLEKNFYSLGKLSVEYV